MKKNKSRTIKYAVHGVFANKGKEADVRKNPFLAFSYLICLPNVTNDFTGNNFFAAFRQPIIQMINEDPGFEGRAGNVNVHDIIITSYDMIDIFENDGTAPVYTQGNLNTSGEALNKILQLPTAKAK